MGKRKRSAARALAWLVAQGCEIAAVAASRPTRRPATSSGSTSPRERLGLPLTDEAALYAEPPAGVDLVVSFLLPAPDPRAAAVARPASAASTSTPRRCPTSAASAATTSPSSRACEEWGVSCHFVDERLDTGDLVEVERFPIDPDGATALSLDLTSQERLAGLFERVIGAPARRRGAAARAAGRGPLRVARGVRGAARDAARATTSSASCGRSGTRPTRARRGGRRPPAHRWWTSACSPRLRAYRDAGRCRDARPRRGARAERDAPPHSRRGMRAAVPSDDELRRLRYREPRRRALLHGLRREARAALPGLRHARSARGPLLHELRPALRTRPRRPGHGAPSSRPRSAARSRCCSPTCPATRRSRSAWTRRR